jgi:hypothetical protein
VDITSAIGIPPFVVEQIKKKIGARFANVTDDRREMTLTHVNDLAFKKTQMFAIEFTVQGKKVFGVMFAEDAPGGAAAVPQLAVAKSGDI